MHKLWLCAAALAVACTGGGGASHGLSDGTWDVTFSRTDYSSAR